MKGILRFFVFTIFIYPISLFSQNGLIGNGFGINNWSTTDDFIGSAGSSRIGTFTANSTGNCYFRLVTNWSGNYNQWGPNSTSDDYPVSPETEVPALEIVEYSTTKAYYINVSSSSHNYVFKTKEGGNPPQNKGLIVFQVQGDIRTISSVSQNPVTVYPGQEVTITASLNGDLSTGQGVYLRYSKDNWTSSSVAEMTYVSDNNYSASISANLNTPSAGFSYYVFTSGDALTISSANADWYTINLNNNNGSNYSYSVQGGWSTATNGDWSTAGTWSANAVPSTSESLGTVTIDHNVTLNQNAKVSAITINASKTLTSEASASRVISILNAGTFTNNGAFTANDGTVVFLGSGTVAGTVTFNNVTINGGVNFGTASTISSTLSLESNSFVDVNCPTYGASSTLKYNTGGNYLISAEWNNTPQNVTVASSGSDVHIDENGKTVAGSLLVENDASLTIDVSKDLTVNGTFTINAAKSGKGAGSFILESTDLGTGSLITKSTVTGNITVERYLTGNWDWHFLSSPVVDQPIAGASNFIAFTFGTGSNEGDPDVDFFRYDETATASPWVNIKGDNGTLNTNFGTPSSNPLFVEGKGYLVAYHTSSITKNFNGVPFTGGLFIPLTYTSGGSQGWNLVGNPYPSAIDWDEGTITKSGLYNEYYYIYNQEMNGGGGGFEYYSSGLSPHSSGANGDIPAMQGFFIKANSGGGSLTLSNNARKHSTQPFLKEVFVNSNLLELMLQGTTYFGKSQIFLSETAEAGVDTQDAFMLFSMNDEVPQVFCLAGNERLVLNSVPVPDNELVLPLGIRVGNTGPFTLSAENIADFNTSYAVILEDLQDNLMVDLRQNQSYTFTTSNGGQHNNRFVLHLKTGVGIWEAENTIQPLVVFSNRQLSVYNIEDGLYQLHLTDVAGRNLFSGNYRVGESLRLPESVKGVCLVRLTGSQKTFVQKVVIR